MNDEQEFVNDNPIVPVKFTPKDSGSYSRFMQRDTIKAESANALEQVLGVKVGDLPYNANTPNYQGQVNFPQPSIVGFGKVTSAGAKDIPFLSDRWDVTKSSTGIYTITHNIGNTQYVPFIQVIETVGNPRTHTISSMTSTAMVIRTFNNAGTATDTAFNFLVYTT